MRKTDQFELENICSALRLRAALHGGVLVAHEGVIVVSHGGCDPRVLRPRREAISVGDES